MTLTRPSDGQPFADMPIADAALVDEAVRAAKAALKSSGWGGLRPRDRVNIMHRWADLVEAEAPTLARLEAVASTRPVDQALVADIAITAEQIRFFAEMADKEGGDVVPTAAGQLGMILSEPYGVIGAITQWNFPLSMAGWKLAPALAAGNAVVLKPSEMTPFSTLHLAEIASRAGVPAGLINIVLGDGATTGNAITGHPDIAKISFTGSTLAGQAIMSNVARFGVKPMTLELGGKSPQIVFANADLDLAARCITGGITYNAGQVCVAGSRLLVHHSVAAQLADAITRLMQSLSPGNTWAKGRSIPRSFPTVSLAASKASSIPPSAKERRFSAADRALIATDSITARRCLLA